MKPHCCPDNNLNNVVIPESLCRESSDFTVFKVTGSPTQTFGDDDFVGLNFHVSSELLHSNNLIVQDIIEFQHQLMGRH